MKRRRQNAGKPVSYLASRGLKMPPGWTGDWGEACDEAKAGDPSALVSLLVQTDQEVPTAARRFLADVLRGKVRLSRTKWRGHTKLDTRARSFIKFAVKSLELDYPDDRTRRATLIKRLAEHYGVSPKTVYDVFRVLRSAK